MTWTKNFDGYDFLLCVWCAQPIPKNIYEKRIAREDPQADACKDCKDVASYEDVEIRKARRWVHPVLGWIQCTVFLGELNDDWNPVDEDGQLFRPGQRICGLKDCVNLTHIVEPQKVKNKKGVRANG